MPDEALIGEFSNHAPGLTSPARKWAAVTPHDTNVLSPTPRALYVGGAGNIVLTGVDGVDATFSAVPAGTVLPVMPRRVKSTGTTATLLIAMY